MSLQITSVSNNPTPSSANNPQPSKKLVYYVKRKGQPRKRVEITKTETVEEFRARQQQASIEKPQPPRSKELYELSYDELLRLAKIYKQQMNSLMAALAAERKKKPRKQVIRNDSFYHSIEWRKLRYFVLKEHGRVCAFCKQTKGVMHVDHIKPRSRFPELALDFSNLQVLCEACNLGKGASDCIDWRKS